jgi:hypothetical protein
MSPSSTKGHWPDAVEEILGGDQSVMLAYVTPAKGVVLTPLTNLAVHDRERGTVTPNSSVAMWGKLERIRRNPRVALAYHTREHGFTDRPEYALLQGKASLTPPDPEYKESIRENWDRFAGPPEAGRLWEWWLRAYHLRVGIEIATERVVVWPDLACSGAPEAHGAPLPAAPPEPQRPPARGTGPRVNHVRAAKRASRLPNVLLGWVGADGLPVVVPVQVEATEKDGIVLGASERSLPPGGRRAGLTAHSFTRYVKGQDQRKHTGWLDVRPDGTAVYAPHTETGYRLPSSWFVYRLGAGFVTRRRLRGARRAGLI